MIDRRRLRRWHIWLGWIIAIPMLFWTVSGVVMVWKPIGEVRGEKLLDPAQPMRFTGPVVTPALAGVPLKSVSLQQRADGPRWVIVLADGKTRLGDPLRGTLLPALNAADAAREIMSRYRGKAAIASVTRTGADNPPLDLRRPIPAWQVAMSDGTRFYVDAGSGEVVARRTGWWRFYDFMWGLHIMDPADREDTHNPWVVTFALISLATVILALILLPMTIRRRKERQ